MGPALGSMPPLLPRRYLRVAGRDVTWLGHPSPRLGVGGGTRAAPAACQPLAWGRSTFCARSSCRELPGPRAVAGGLSSLGEQSAWGSRSWSPPPPPSAAAALGSCSLGVPLP